MRASETRAVSAVVGVVLLTALTAVLAGGVLAAGTAMSSLNDPPPSVVVESEPVVAACAGCGPDDQVVRVRHVSGDAVSLADAALAVETPDDRGRLVELPLTRNCIPDVHVEGTDLFDGRCGRVSGPLTSVGSDADGQWTAGETLAVRIQKAAVRLDPDDDLTVRVVHAPSGQTVAEATPTVVASAG